MAQKFKVSFEIDTQGVEATHKQIKEFLEFEFGVIYFLNAINPLLDYGIAELRPVNIEIKEL